MKTRKSLIRKILKGTAISFAVLLLLMVLLPVLFPGKVAGEVKVFANKKLNGELNFKEARLSFFNHFPSLTLTLDEFSLKGSKPFSNDNLVSANEIALGINLKSLIFDGIVEIDEIYVSGANINVRVNSRGEANYNVYVSDEADSQTTGSSETSMRLEKIAFENCHVVYDDRSAKILIDAKGFNYVGNGDLDQSVFDIHTKADIAALDFVMDGEPYLKNKEVHAKLVTKINTNSLALIFEKNDLKINKLPVAFNGKFDFLKNGYSMDFNVRSEESELNDFFTALPPQYVKWLETTKVRGETTLSLSLKGNYIASENQKPSLAFNMKIRDGEIKYKEAPQPVSNIFLNFDTRLPSLDVEQLQVNLDSLYLNLGNDYLKAIVKSKGLSKPVVNAEIKASLNLAELDRALQLPGYKLSGILNADIVSNGIYDGDKRIFPKTRGKITMKNGSVKTPYYPNPINKINVNAELTNGNGAFADTKFAITPASFTFEGKPFYLSASFDNFDDVAYDITAKGEIDVARIYKVFSQKGLDLDGFIKADVAFKGRQSDATQGRMANLNNRGTLELRNIRTTSEYLPKPFVIAEGLFTFNQDQMAFSGFKAVYGQSDFAMTGQLRNVINFALSDRETLQGGFDFKSNYINADEFMMPANPTATPAQEKANTAQPSGVIVVPSNFDLQLNANAQKVDFNGLSMTNANGSMAISRGTLSLKKTGFELIGCKVSIDADYASETPNRAGFDFRIIAKDFDIKRAYNEIPLFKEMASAAEKAEGIVSLDYQLSGKLDSGMAPILPSLEGGGVLSVKKVKMHGFKMFNTVSQKTSTSALNDPDVTKVDIRSKIKNNIITLERFKFKVAGFRPRIEGTTSLDGNLNLKMRLGLPPLGIIGIPLTITGTQEDPKIKLGRKTEDLQETEYVEGMENIPAPSESKPAETLTPVQG